MHLKLLIGGDINVHLVTIKTKLSHCYVRVWGLAMEVVKKQPFRQVVNLP